MYNSKTQHYD